MANMFPNKFNSKIKSEEFVYNKIRETFPSTVDAYYSVKFINDKKNKIDGECDFVLIDKNRGITYIEVKGGKEVGAIKRGDRSVFYTIPNFKENKEYSTNPYDQAYDAMYSIKQEINNLIKDKSKELSTKLFRRIIVFPGTNNLIYLEQLRNYHKDRTATKDDFENFFEFYQKIWNEKYKITPAQLKIINELFQPSGIFVKTISNELQHLSFEMDQLTEEQNEANRRIQDYPKVRIYGGPGTGKTWLALNSALLFSKTESKVLLICYSNFLSNFLKSQMGIINLKENFIDIFSFEELLKILAKENNLDFDPEKLSEEVYLNELIFEIDYKPKYNVILIDEAQDFAMGSDWIELIEGMLIDDDNKRFILFHDDNQQIYSDNKLILNDFIPYPLDTNIRNTREIHQLIRNFYRGGRYLSKRELSYHDPIQIYSDSFETGINNLAEIIDDHEEEFSNMVVLTADDEDKELIINSKLKSNFTTDLFNRKNKIYLSKILDYKGLESKIVILFSNGKLLDKEKLFYTGISRANSLLFMIVSREEYKIIKPRH